VKTYHSLTLIEQHAIEQALDLLTKMVKERMGWTLANDDRAARAAEALAVYIKESQG